jgi:mRNA interferase MazF
MARGDVVIINFPIPSGPAGREQVGTRPAVAVQTDFSDADLPTTIVVPMTSTLGVTRFPHTIYVNPSPQNGLSIPSVLLVFQLRAIDKSRVGRRIGRLEQSYLQQLENEMREILGL